MKTRWLGRVKFEDALSLQNELVSAKIADRDVPDELLLLEHDPVFTIGRTHDQSSLRGRDGASVPCVVTNRGGQATWHGPGQLVGYPIVDLRRHGSDLHRYLRTLEQAVIAICAAFGVRACTRDGLTGVWVEERKIASIGVGVRRWISMHGFALNVRGALEGFHAITPCGIAGVTMTSLEREGARQATVEQAVAFAEEVLPPAFGGVGAGA